MYEPGTSIGKIQIFNQVLNLKSLFYQNARTAITVESLNGEPFGTLTTNIPGVTLEADEVIIRTWGENEQLIGPAMATGAFIDTGKRVNLRFVTAEIWKLAPRS